MTLNRTNIEWCGGGFSWNPVSGCDHPFNKVVPTNPRARACEYCYACVIGEVRYKGSKGFPNGFAPTFHPKRLNDPRAAKIPSLIFTVSTGDLFCPGAKQEWREQIYDSMITYDQHVYLILTKAPGKIESTLYGKSAGYRLGGGDWYDHIWFETTVDTASAVKRLDALKRFNERTGGDWHLFVSFEPLLEQMPSDLNLNGIEWVIIGQRTKPNNHPPLEWILNIMDRAADYQIPVFIKNNILEEYFPDRTDLQNYPKRLSRYVHKKER